MPGGSAFFVTGHNRHNHAKQRGPCPEAMVFHKAFLLYFVPKRRRSSLCSAALPVLFNYYRNTQFQNQVIFAFKMSQTDILCQPLIRRYWAGETPYCRRNACPNWLTLP